MIDFRKDSETGLFRDIAKSASSFDYIMLALHRNEAVAVLHWVDLRPE
jgi:hypothetical protein